MSSNAYPFLKTDSDREMYSKSKANHKVACGGKFISFTEFMAQPYTDRKNFTDWLRRQARDVAR